MIFELSLTKFLGTPLNEDDTKRQRRYHQVQQSGHCVKQKDYVYIIWREFDMKEIKVKSLLSIVILICYSNLI